MMNMKTPKRLNDVTPEEWDRVCKSQMSKTNPESEKLMNEPTYTFEDLWHEDFYDIVNVLVPGAKKHGARNWEAGNQGSKSSFKEMHDSMFHHLADSYNAGWYGGQRRLDIETKTDQLLNLATRALMCYSLIKRGKYNES
jgi:hypothetical protein